MCKADGKFEEKAAAKCHKDATCTIKGQRGCHCKKGLKGDGVTKCESKKSSSLKGSGTKFGNRGLVLVFISNIFRSVKSRSIAFRMFFVQFYENSS